MPSLSYRFLRRKVLHWIPTTVLGKITAYVGAIWLGVHALRLTIILLSPSSGALSSWATTFDYVFGLFLGILLLRWIRRALLWRLRNRLIVTYVFIGVIPVLLILVMVGVAGYMISNHYAQWQSRVTMAVDTHPNPVAAESQAS